MKTLFAVLILIVVVVLGVGVYQGWFGLSTGSADGKSTIALTVDQDKISEDARAAQEKVQKLGRDVKDKTAPAVEKTPDKE